MQFWQVMARPQLTTQKSNNFLLFLITTKERVTELKVMSGLIMDFGSKFLNARQPVLCYEKQFIKR